MKRTILLFFLFFLIINAFSQSELNSLFKNFNLSIKVCNPINTNSSCIYRPRNLNSSLSGKSLIIQYDFSGWDDNDNDDIMEFHVLNINLKDAKIYNGVWMNNFGKMEQNGDKTIITITSKNGIDLTTTGKLNYNKGVKHHLIDSWRIKCESEALANRIVSQLNNLIEPEPNEETKSTNPNVNNNSESKPTQKPKQNIENKTKIESKPYQTFTKAGFKVKCGCKFYVNTTFIQLAKQQGVNDIIAAYICAENKDNPNIGVVFNINVYDRSKSYQNIQSSAYATFEKKYLGQYASNLKNAGISYTYTTYQGVSAIEYTFDQQGLPAKAIIFLKNKKSYLLQVGTRKSLTTKFNSLKSSFVIL